MSDKTTKQGIDTIQAQLDALDDGGYTFHKFVGQGDTLTAIFTHPTISQNRTVAVSQISTDNVSFTGIPTVN